MPVLLISAEIPEEWLEERRDKSLLGQDSKATKNSRLQKNPQKSRAFRPFPPDLHLTDLLSVAVSVAVSLAVYYLAVTVTVAVAVAVGVVEAAAVALALVLTIAVSVSIFVAASRSWNRGTRSRLVCC